MKRTIPLAAALVSLSVPVFAAETFKPIEQRFASEGVEEVPDFRRHVTPLMGKLGCNGRACHGSFQGRGGFRLSLFGYDFKMDHDGLTKADPENDKDPRVDLKFPAASLMLEKTTLTIPHKGGKRIEFDSWQHRVFLSWIKGGAKGVGEKDPDFVRLEVTPKEMVFGKAGQTSQLKVVAVWSDGSREDVTSLCRFTSNDDQVAKITVLGRVTGAKPGDTHVVVFYDSGVVPVPVMRPVSDRVGPKYPKIETPTQIDELVVQKLRKLGIVPSPLASDAEFLRRVSLDMTGTLPTAQEVEAFLNDSTQDKRSRKIDELLERPAYAAWWTTRLCDITGNNSGTLNNVIPRGARGSASQDWYDWIQKRVADNTPYDELVAGIVMATSRNKDESFTEYCETMNALYRPNSEGKFADRESMPHYWARRTFRQPPERAIGFAYTFLGIRIQCAQCHKHPFDRWTKNDFERFQGFFARVDFRVNPESQLEYNALNEKLGLKGKKGGELKKALREVFNQGKMVPFQEVYAVKPGGRKGNRNRKNNNNKALRINRKQLAALVAQIQKLKDAGDEEAAKKLEPKRKKLQKRIQQAQKQPKPQTATAMSKLLGGDEIDLSKYPDARTPLMQWLRSKDNQYFARAFVNRVWAAYFNVGIVEPPDNLALANPPSNKELLDYLSDGFIEHGFDMKWLHREIANSRTYQLSWKPNETNRLDERNFSHAIPRRMPAEVAYDALQQATASDTEIAALHSDPKGRAIAIPSAGRRGKKGNQGVDYALTIFGRSVRESNCDCDRSSEASLLQTVYLQNDQDVFGMIDRSRGGWLNQVASELGLNNLNKRSKQLKRPAAPRNFQKQLAAFKNRLKKARQSGNEQLVAKMERQLAGYRKRFEPAKQPRPKNHESSEKPVASVPMDSTAIVTNAYLRTLSRFPNEEELNRSRKYINESADKLAGIKGLLWALLNTKEFIVNH